MLVQRKLLDANIEVIFTASEVELGLAFVNCLVVVRADQYEVFQIIASTPD